jgi:hypothetical protein
MMFQEKCQIERMLVSMGGKWRPWFLWAEVMDAVFCA